MARKPGALDELTQCLAATGTDLIAVAADATDPAAMQTLFDRFGTELPPLEESIWRPLRAAQRC